MHLAICCSSIMDGHTAMKGERIHLCMLPQSSYLACIAQIDCREFFDSRRGVTYLVRVVLCASNSSRVACLSASVWFVVGPIMWLLLPWACMPWAWHAFLRGRKSCQRTSLFHKPSPRRIRYQDSPLKEGISIFILYSLELESPLLLSGLGKENPPPLLGFRIGPLPRASLVSHPSIISFIFEVVFLIEGIDEFLLVGEIFVRKIP